MEAIQFSLICVTKDRTQEVDRLIASLRHQEGIIFELILIDQNEDDRILDLINNTQEEFKIVYRKVSFNNLSRARNLGIAIASGEWLSFPDDDCWYSVNLLTEIQRQIRLEPTTSLIFVNWTDPKKDPKIFKHDHTTGFMTKDELYRKAASICIFVQREQPNKNTIVFNERLGLGADTIVKAGEDQELLLRLHSNGTKVRKRLDLEVHHAIDDRKWTSTFRQRIIGSGAVDFFLTRQYFNKISAWTLVTRWIIAVFYNIARNNKHNMQWYLYKLYGAITLSWRIECEKCLPNKRED